MLEYISDPALWAQQHFGENQLGDKRRTNRVISLSQAMASNPGFSLPKLCPTSYDLTASYDLFQCRQITPCGIQQTHRKLVSEEIATSGTYIFPQDTTTCSWSGKKPIPELGPIGNAQPGLQGFMAHSVIAARWPGLPDVDEEFHRPSLEIIGLAHQQFIVRPPKTHSGETKRELYSRPRESAIWPAASASLGPAPEGVRWVRVCDREADIYEFMISCDDLGHGYVIRAMADRIVLDPETEQPLGSLFAVARQGKLLGHFQLSLRARPGCPARVARLNVHCCRVRLRSPQRPMRGAGRLPSILCTVLWVSEQNPPEHVKEPLEWVLLCDTEVESFEQALECVMQYSSRWICEEFHKALKTGLGLERLQLEHGHNLINAAALMSVVALRSIDLRERVRLMGHAPAEKSGLSELELAVLGVKFPDREIKTVRDVALAIGRLGGHLNRRGDGMPGWQTLMAGLVRLQTLVEGVRLSKLLTEKSGGTGG
jgi:hypothetical protein